jgi:hypothetical protein
MIVLVLIVFLASFSGCIGKNGDAEFKSHVEKATEHVKRGSDLELEAIKKGKEEDYDATLELLYMAIYSYESAKNEMNLAYSNTEDEQKQNWVKCMNEMLDLFIQRAEKISVGTEFDKNGNVGEARKTLDEINQLNEKINTQKTKCASLGIGGEI